MSDHFTTLRSKGLIWQHENMFTILYNLSTGQEISIFSSLKFTFLWKNIFIWVENLSFVIISSNFQISLRFSISQHVVFSFFYWWQATIPLFKKLPKYTDPWLFRKLLFWKIPQIHRTTAVAWPFFHKHVTYSKVFKRQWLQWNWRWSVSSVE